MVEELRNRCIRVLVFGNINGLLRKAKRSSLIAENHSWRMTLLWCSLYLFVWLLVCFNIFIFLFLSESCKDPGVPQNGHRIGSNFDHGAVVKFHCKNGTYDLLGAKDIKCNNGEWNNLPPTCKGNYLLQYSILPLHGVNTLSLKELYAAY